MNVSFLSLIPTFTVWRSKNSIGRMNNSAYTIWPCTSRWIDGNATASGRFVDQLREGCTSIRTAHSDILSISCNCWSNESLGAGSQSVESGIREGLENARKLPNFGRNFGERSSSCQKTIMGSRSLELSAPGLDHRQQLQEFDHVGCWETPEVHVDTSPIYHEKQHTS